MDLVAESADFKNHSRVDRVGIIASVLCAIHCALTPVLLIMLPTFGKAWAHPSTHWGMALVVIPIAVYMMRKGYQRHAKKWIVMTGTLGIIFIIIGAILPYTAFGEPAPQSEGPIQAAVSPTEPETCSSEDEASPG